MIERRLITTNLIATFGTLACIWKQYAPSFFQHAFPGKLTSLADMSTDILQKAHPAAKGPVSTRVIESIVSKVEMFQMIYV